MSWIKDHFRLTSPQPEQRSTEWGQGRVTGVPGEPTDGIFDEDAEPKGGQR